MLKRQKQRGDTIVEVLIAIGIVSLVLAASYVTAHRSYLTMQDAQEHSFAMKLLEQQTEALKAYDVLHHTELKNDAAAGFCMNVGSSPSVVTDLHNCVLNSSGTVAAAGQEPAYALEIKLAKDASGSPIAVGDGVDFMLTAKWASVLGDNSQSMAQMEYGLY